MDITIHGNITDIKFHRKKVKRKSWNNKIESNTSKHYPKIFSEFDAYSTTEIETNLNKIIDQGQEINRERILEAEKIGFKNILTDKVIYDEYGFLNDKFDKRKSKTINGKLIDSLDGIITENLKFKKKEYIQSNIKPSEHSNQLFNQYSNQQNERILKWTEMLQNFDFYVTKKYEKIKERTRKGIPDSMRAAAWSKMAKVEYLRNGNEKLYTQLIEKIEANKKDNETGTTEDLEENNGNSYSNKINNQDLSITKDEEVIIRDLHRTFPMNIIFMNKLGEGQRALYRVLLAFANYNKSTGYVQGMGFPVALFLTYMSEEQSFWLMISLMKNYGLESCFLQGFPGLQKNSYLFLNLLKKFLPRIYERFKNLNILPTIYASQWFFTCFANTFNFKILTRIFDCLFLEGYKIIYRISLAIFKIKENIILKHQNFEDILEVLRTITDDIEPEHLFNVAFSFSFSRKDLITYDLRYEYLLKNKELKDKDEIMKQVCF